jgi:hypothetical protein
VVLENEKGVFRIFFLGSFIQAALFADLSASDRDSAKRWTAALDVSDIFY